MDFRQPYNQKEFIKFLNNFLPDDFEQTTEPINIKDLSFKPDRIKRVKLIGHVPSLENLHVYEIEHESESDPRVTLSRETFRLMSNYGVRKALAVFISRNSHNYRFSLATIDLKLEGSRVTKDYSNPRRYSFFLGPDAKVHTPTIFLIGKGRINNFDDLLSRFSVEIVTKEFFSELSNWYFWTLKNIKCPKDAEKEQHGKNIFTIRLITRLIFIWFMKQKGLIPENLFNREYLETILKDLSQNETTYYKAVLQNLFFATLNTPIKARDFRTEKTYRGKNKDFMNPNVYRFHKLFTNPEDMKSIFNNIPFLNGGLFECLDRIAESRHSAEVGSVRGSKDEGKYIRIDGFSDREDSQANVPNFLFYSDKHFEDLNEDYGTKEKKYTVRGIIDLLQIYNFTIDESTPVDVEIALDPELLGRVFENLLASYNPETATTARKATGSYYTPREIVDYMVTQSLKEYFKTKLPNIENIDDKLNNLLSYDSEENPFNDSETNTLMNSVNNLKIIDPAVGSGAFPMGILQKLVLVLSKLGTHNRQWKKPLIQNCIYGVDIQPIATQIAKLRFFISLLVDEKIDREQENYGIEPLPNLELNFISANSLIGLNLKGQLDLKDPRLSKLEEELKRVREIYFRTSAINEKEKLREKDKEIRNKISALLKESGFPSEDTKKISDWDPYNSNKSADWFDPEWMFGVKDGFDVVIANPPYVKKENLSMRIIEQLEQVFIEIKNGKEKHWSDDLYVHFIFKGLELVRKSGIMTYITNDSFIGLASKERVRKLLLQNNFIKLIKCPKETFEAMIYTAVFILRKEEPKNKQYESGIFEYPSFLYQKIGPVLYTTIHTLPDIRLLFAKPILSMYSKFINYSKVKKYFDILDTGIHSGNVREKIFFKEKVKANIVRLLQGKQIKKYGIFWDSEENKYKYCDIHYVPQKTKGVGRKGKISKHEEYWHFCGDIKNHHQPERLLMRQSDDDLIVAYHNEREMGQFYTDNTLFTILPNKKAKDEKISLKYALALLNSNLLNTFYHFLSQEEGKTLAQVKVGLVNELPFIINNQKSIVEIVDRILNLTGSKDYLENTTKQIKVSEYERQLDQLIYKIYGLTEKEIVEIEEIKEVQY
ncbi:MAG: N-6 DNA methylase [Elusimicrobiota bacterium]